MRIHWSHRSVPELAKLAPTQREDVWCKCHKKAWRHWQSWYSFAMVGIWPPLGFITVVLTGAPRVLVYGIFLILLATFYFIFVNTVISKALPYIRDETSGS
jgi:fatty-acid desaturase